MLLQFVRHPAVSGEELGVIPEEFVHVVHACLFAFRAVSPLHSIFYQTVLFLLDIRRIRVGVAHLHDDCRDSRKVLVNVHDVAERVDTDIAARCEVEIPFTQDMT